ncbi:MAG TPA: hypothetical protein VHO01_06765 [Jatrophihabitans sp.]|nr:hypothetical protein [Jatrophihabitans sp.]
MSARTLHLPRLVAGRDYADDLVRSLVLEPGAEVLVDGSGLLSGTPSFAAELVQRILVDGKARSLRLVGAPGEFTGYAETAAKDLDVQDRFQAAAHLSPA